MILVWEDSSRSAFPHIPCRVTTGIVSIPESSALTLRLVDDDEDAADDVAVSAREAVVIAGSAREVVPLLEKTAESKSLPIFFLCAAVIFDQLLSEIARWLNSMVNL